MSVPRDPASKPPRLLAYLTGAGNAQVPPAAKPLIGVLEGDGIGPDVIQAALQVLAAVQQVLGLDIEIQHGASADPEARARSGGCLPDEAADFCARIFERGGTILHGPEGGRYVYDLRRRFDLFCKFVPVRPCPELAHAGRLVPEHLKDVDILIVRDNIGGVYQGQWAERITIQGRIAEHSFQYAEWEVQRLVEVAARAAADRRGRLNVILKENGVPAVCALWRDVGRAVARKQGVEAVFMNVDLAAYELIQNPAGFDVMVAPNLFGDILADLAGVLVASRGITYSGNFDSRGHGVYQTSHGCALDLVGAGAANPAGQMLSLAMLLGESFHLGEAAALIRQSLAEVWRQGWRTADLAEPGCRMVGTQALTERIICQILRRREGAQSHERRFAAG